MGLFSLNNILLEQDTTHSNRDVIDIDNIGYMSAAIRETSFVQEGYNAILEMNAFYCNAEKEFYHKILESCGDDHIINEGFNEFFDNIKKIIKKFIEWIKKIFKEFAAKLAGLVQSEKYIKKHKDLFNKFSSEDEFEFQGYKFTHVDTSTIPLANADDVFAAGETEANKTNNYSYLNFSKYFKNDEAGTYYNTVPDITNISFDNVNDNEATRRKVATEKINKAISDDIDAITDNNEDFYEYFRGRVLGKTEKLDSKEFSDECFKIFRDDSDSTSSITIDYNFVHEAYRRFDKYKDTTKAIEKLKNDIVKDYEDLEKRLDKMIKYNKDSHKLDITSDVGRGSYTTDNLKRIDFSNVHQLYDSSTADRMSSLLKVYSARVNQMCQIHTQAFTAKLDACKDCFKQDKQILNKAIQHILKRSNKEGF